MKETSYPSTLVKSKSGGIDTDSIYSFKERRKYDDIGRLRALDINTSDVYNMHTISTDGNTMAASYDDRTIMYFPICTPEIIVNGSKQSGTGIITWVHFVFRPAKNYSVTGLGSNTWMNMKFLIRQNLRIMHTALESQAKPFLPHGFRQEVRN